MAYNFLGLVNDVCNRLNEVNLTSGNFSTYNSGYYGTVKEAVNASIRKINQEDFMWPDNFSLQTDTLSAGTLRYSYPATAKWIDFNTFRVQRNATFGNDTQKLRVVDYEEYLQSYIDDEYNSSDTGIRGLPKWVARAPSNEYIVWPSPDQAYSLDYEMYTFPVDLSAYTDAPSLGESFRKVIVDGAIYYLYLWRSNIELAREIKTNFGDGIKDMKGLQINRYEYMRDTRVPEKSGHMTAVKTS